MKKLALLMLFLVVSVILVDSPLYAAVNQDYEDDKGPSQSCPDVGQVSDSWCFYTCNCTSYVAWKLNEYFTERSASNPLFTNSYYGLYWGHAYNWKRLVDNETFAHYNRTPEYLSSNSPSYPWKFYGNGGVFDVRAAVAWWDSSGGACGSGGLSCGHVAFVESANWNDGVVESIVVSEYNFNSPLQYTASRTLYPGTSNYPDGFLYIVTDTFQECDLTGLCQGSGSCSGGSGGGSVPDFIVNDIWLENQLGQTKTVFRPGETITMKAKIKNVGTNSPMGIEAKFYLSNGEEVDSDKEPKETVNIDENDLESGETHTTAEELFAPSARGTYNITVCADTDEEVEEEHERNNCSDEAVFRVDDFAWLVPIINLILQ